MDTGTTYSFFSQEYALALYKGVTGVLPTKSLYSFWEIDCSYSNSTDFIQVSLTHDIHGNAERAPLNLRAPVSSFISPSERKCVWTILGNSDTEILTDSMLLLGQNFLRNFYVVHNMTSVTSMGFAPALNYQSQVTF